MKNSIKITLGVAIILLVSGIAIWLAKKAPVMLARPTKAPSLPLVTVPVSMPPSILPDTVSNTSPMPPVRKFKNLGVLERNAILAEIRKKDLITIFTLFLDAGRQDQDPMKQGAIQSTLALAMREQAPSTEFLDKTQKFLADDSNTMLERGMLIGSFSLASTKESVDVLLWAATGLPDEELRRSAIHALSRTGEYGDTAYQVDLSMKLDRVWRDSDDREMLGTIADPMARMGIPGSINLLLAAALAPDGKDDVRKQAALDALKKVFRKNAVSPLADALKSNPIGSAANTLAFNTLGQIGDVTAVQTLISWLQVIDASAASLAQQWIAHARDTTQLDGARAALNPTVPFRNEANREALRAGLADYNATHVTVRPGAPLP